MPLKDEPVFNPDHTLDTPQYADIKEAIAGVAPRHGLRETDDYGVIAVSAPVTTNPISKRALEHLRALLKFETVNPPGNETPAARWVEQRLLAAGLEPVFLEPAEGRGNVVCRIAGATDEPPLLLTGHLDVVPVDLEHWDVPPFEAQIKNGYLYGRGTIDMKNHVASCLSIVEAIAQSGQTPRRDIIFAAVADEEEGCAYGSRYLVEEHPELVRAGWMIGEVGGHSMDVNGVRYYPVQIAEKGTALIRMTAKGEPGHGSAPHGQMAMTRLGEALAKLGNNRLPQHNTPVVEAFIRKLAAHQPMPQRAVMPLLLKPALAEVLLTKLLSSSQARSMGALLSNTVSATLLQGSVKFNIIPGEVSATLDGRTLPGQTGQDLVRELRELLGDDLSFEILEECPSLSQPRAESPLFTAICDTLKRHDPAGIPLPTLIPGFTDAQYFSRLGARCYGFSPHRYPREDNIRFMDLFHGHNERIHVDGYQWGVQMLTEVIERFCGLKLLP